MALKFLMDNKPCSVCKIKHISIDKGKIKVGHHLPEREIKGSYMKNQSQYMENNLPKSCLRTYNRSDQEEKLRIIQIKSVRFADTYRLPLTEVRWLTRVKCTAVMHQLTQHTETQILIQRKPLIQQLSPAIYDSMAVETVHKLMEVNCSCSSQLFLNQWNQQHASRR